MVSALPQNFILIGQGLGGDVALDLARRLPDRMKGLVLISTDPLSEAPSVAAEREMRMLAARAGRLPEAMRGEYPAQALADSPWRGEVLALVQDMALNLGEGVYLRQSRPSAPPGSTENDAENQGAGAGSGRGLRRTCVAAPAGVFGQSDAQWSASNHSRCRDFAQSGRA